MYPAATILLVDDEENILRSLKRIFMDQDFRILATTSPFDALELLKTNAVSVIISDNLMPGMNGIDFLQQAKFLSPESVRVMMTGYADVHAAIDAINKGEVFKFLTKPWDVEEFRNVVFDSINRHDMVHSLRQADESKLYSLAQTIELKDPYTRGHCDRVAQYSLAMAELMGLEDDRRTFIKHGSWLHDCGKIGVPEVILNFSGPLSPEQMEIVRNHSRWGAEVARLARLPEAVINIILFHHEKYDGTGYPANLKGDEIPVEARIVSVADIYDALTSARPYRGAMDSGKAARILVEGKGTHSDPAIVDIFLKIIGNGDG
jgi:putative nucleotidyltransferase with HDIG domain